MAARLRSNATRAAGHPITRKDSSFSILGHSGQPKAALNFTHKALIRFPLPP